MRTPTEREEKIFGRSSWIWPVDYHCDLYNGYALFRKAFTLEKTPAKAPLFITADQSYRLYVNGRFVCRGPARGFQSHWPYDEVDVHPFLKKGKNQIAIRAYNPGHSNFQYLTRGFAGLLVASRWGKTEIRSDATWRSIRQANTKRDTVPVSVQLFCQEHIDLRQEAGDWTSLDFDDSAWIAPKPAVWNSGPWFSLEPRGIPLLREKELPCGKLIGLGQGACASGYESVRDVTLLRYQEDRSHQPTSLPSDPLHVTATGKGKFRSYLFDFGKTVVGNLTFNITGAQGGEIIDTLHVESIDKKTLTPDQEIPNGCMIAFGSRLVCRAGDAGHSFFHSYGFRYLVVTVRDATADFQLRLHLNWNGYPLERNGSFTSSDTDLEKIWETCAWTQQCCSLDSYVDTPWREQAQWWGDARVQAWNTFYLSGDARLFRRGIAQIGAQTTPDGVTYGHAPTMAHNCILPDFTLIWLLTIWDYYWQTGSTEPLITHHATVQKALDYFRNQIDPKTGLLTYDPRYWLFLDWTGLFRDGSSTVYNLWLLLALEKLAILYRKAHRPKEAAPLETWAKKLRVSLEKLVTRQGLMRDGINRRGKIVSDTSIHAQTLALQAGLKGMNARHALDQVLLPFLRESTMPSTVSFGMETQILPVHTPKGSKPRAVPSAYWVTYVLTVLASHGYGDEVLAFIKNFWTPMVEHGTTWEGYKPRLGGESFSHAWSAHPLYHFMQIVGGITQTGPHWSEIAFQPVFHGTQGGCTIPSPRGPIVSEWKKENEKMRVHLRLPRNVKARIHLPGLRPATITQSQSWVLTLKTPSS